MMEKTTKPRELVFKGRRTGRAMARAECRKSTCGDWYITANADVAFNAAEARRLAAWLIRAAEWIEGREG